MTRIHQFGVPQQSPSSLASHDFVFGGGGPSTENPFQFTGERVLAYARSRSRSRGAGQLGNASSNSGSISEVAAGPSRKDDTPDPTASDTSPSTPRSTPLATAFSSPGAASFQWTPTPSSQVASPRASAVGGDSVRPSIERPVLTPKTSASSRRSTPSISLSPPPSFDGRREGSTTPSASSRGRSQRSLLAGALGNLAVSQSESPMDMAALGTAIENVANGDDEALQPDLRHLARPSPAPGPQSPDSRARDPPHDVQSEEPPAGRFNNPDVQQALYDSTSLMGKLSGVLAGSLLRGQEGSTIGRLYRESQRLAAFEVQATRTVGFVGDSGVGKSRLLNSLLDHADLSRTSNSGGACTCVATEFHYHDRDDFAIEVELFAPEAVKDQVTSLLHVYRQHHGGEETASQAEGGTSDAYQVAESTFKTLFGARRANRAFLCGRDVNAITSQLHGWVDEGYPRDMAARRSGISSKEECSDALMRLTSPSAGAESGKWPYIQRVKVFLKAHILSTGLILVDLPGLRDINAARVAVTERHMQRCNEIFAVSRIGRATTDVGVRSVFDHARQARLSNVGILCTHSDDIEAREARRDWTGQDAEGLDGLIDAVADVRHRKEQHDEETPDDTDLKTMAQYNKETRVIRQQKKKAELELKRYLVETRNRHITRKLKRTYDERALDGNARVFCVSNTLYADWRDRPRNDSYEWLGLSGIIGLRRHCLGLTMESQMRSLRNYITADVPTLLGEVDLWVQSGAETADAEQKRKIREALDEFERNVEQTLSGDDALAPYIGFQLKEVFRRQIYNTRRTAEWTAEAARAAQDWRRLDHPVFKAFCRKFGAHRPGAPGWRWCGNWNEQVVRGVLRDIEAPWGSIFSTIRDMQLSIEDAAEEASIADDAQIREAFRQNDRRLQSIQRPIRSREQAFLEGMRDVWHRLDEQLRNSVYVKAFSHGDMSNIVGLLKPSYDECNADTEELNGPGVDSRRKKVMCTALENPSLFENLMLEASQLFGKAVDGFQVEVDETVGAFLHGIAETFDFVRKENAAMESEQDPELRNRLERWVAEAIEEVRGLEEVVVADQGA